MRNSRGVAKISENRISEGHIWPAPGSPSSWLFQSAGLPGPVLPQAYQVGRENLPALLLDRVEETASAI